MKKVSEVIRALVKAFKDALAVDSTDQEAIAKLKADNAKLQQDLAECHADDAETAVAMQEAQDALNAATAATAPTPEAVQAVAEVPAA